MVIAIDGQAGSGKTTTAKYVAEILGFIHINTGAMYRGIALKCIQQKIDLENKGALEKILGETTFQFSDKNGSGLFMDGQDITDEIIRAEVTGSVSYISTIPVVRERLVQYQREMAEGKDVVLEGRDIGTVVFPNADYKFFLVADLRERAKRRIQEMKAKGISLGLEELTHALEERDKKDSTRDHSPLKKAEDAVEIDTTGLNIEDQIRCIVEIVNKSNK